MEEILNESLTSFQDFTDKMSYKVQRQAWTFFLEKTVICYIQCMLNSSLKIKQGSSEKVVDKIREDYEKIQDRFKEYMTFRLMRSGIEVLGDLLSFFESSPAFISVATEKLRKQHGPNFKLQTVKAIMNLRSDLSKEERAEALKICKDVLDQYADGQYDQKIRNKNG